MTVNLSHPSHPSHQTRRSAARRKLSTGPRRDIVVAQSTLWLLSRLVAVEVAEAQWQLYSFWSKYHKRLVPSRQKPTGCYTLSGAIVTSAQFSDKFGTFEHQILKPHRKTKRNTSFEPKIEKSPTYGDFENFYPHPQLDIKFLNP